MLYRHNWTAEAGKVLRQFELDVIRKAKTDGYDGQEATDDTEYQWDFSGSLLYSVTVITTIGKQNISVISRSFTTTYNSTKKVLIETNLTVWNKLQVLNVDQNEIAQNEIVKRVYFQKRFQGCSW